MGWFDLSWAAVFGAPWFWAAATLVWARAALSLLGAPLRLIRQARRGAEAVSAGVEPPESGLAPAAFALDLLRWRLGAGRGAPGLAPLRWPALGGAAAWAVSGAAFGDLLALALLTALGPIAAASLALEPPVLQAVDAARGAGTPAARLAAFADRLEQLWRLKLAACLAAAALTLAAAAATRAL